MEEQDNEDDSVPALPDDFTDLLAGKKFTDEKVIYFSTLNSQEKPEDPAITENQSLNLDDQYAPNSLMKHRNTVIIKDASDNETELNHINMHSDLAPDSSKHIMLEDMVSYESKQNVCKIKCLTSIVSFY